MKGCHLEPMTGVALLAGTAYLLAVPEVRPKPAMRNLPRGPLQAGWDRSSQSASRAASHGQQVGRATHSLRAGSAREACHQGIWVSVPCGHSGGLAEAAVALASSSPLPAANQ